MSTSEETGELPLETSYTFWEHQPTQRSQTDSYLAGIMEICTCNTVAEFWKCWNNILQPRYLIFKIFRDAFSRVLSDKVQFNIKNGNFEKTTEVEALSIFKSGIEPKWEDKENIKGFDIQIKCFFYF